MLCTRCLLGTREGEGERVNLTVKFYKPKNSKSKPAIKEIPEIAPPLFVVDFFDGFWLNSRAA